jgi:uncharacterized membrane protein YcaP (DUF421 family)
MNVDWSRTLALHTPVLEILVRGTIVYLTIFFLLRFTFKREVGTIGTGNLLVLVLVADAAQNAMAGQYDSVADGLLLVATIAGWSIAIDAAAYRWRWAARLARPRPVALVRNGQVQHRHMRRELITADELGYELRQRGVSGLSEVKDVYMEPDGQISVIRRDQQATDAPGPKQRLT